LLVETLAFLFTDIEGSTELLRRVGEGVYARLLADHHTLVRSALAAHQGREVDTQGDAFFAVFSSVRACVAAVLEMQDALESHCWPPGENVRVRMGVHAGEAEQTTAGLVGLDVHRAARIAAIAYGGQVLLSETAATMVRRSLPATAWLKDLGSHRLKDLGRPEQIFQLCAGGLQAEFPPLRSLGNPALANNLPAQLSPFVGRDREVAEVRSLVGSSRLVTLTGPGGAGKTRLALQAAANLLDGSGEGVWLVELASVTDEDEVPLAIAAPLRITLQRTPSARDSLAEALAPQDILIVLDNCEHLIGACAKTADVLLRHCRRVHLLVTSREPLGIGGETIYQVPSLSLPGPDDETSAALASDAVALFADRARSHGLNLDLADGETADLLVSVCRRLDGMPLAIELAAARLRSMSLGELCDRLDDRFRLLTGGSRTALERQQTLRATVGWSYSLLTTTEQLLLGRLSVFAGTFALPAAEAVCGFRDIDKYEVADLLGSLVDKSLVVAEPSVTARRYRLLESIRLFAAERLVETVDAAAAATAHCDYFLASAETAAAHLTGPDQGNWLARLDADHANLMHAARYAAARGGTALVLRFGAALDRYWNARFGQQEAFALLAPVLDSPDADADAALHANALITAAWAVIQIDRTASLRLAEHAVEIARRVGDDRLVVRSLAALCVGSGVAGDPAGGHPAGRESVELARKLGDDLLLGVSLHAYLAYADPAESGALYAEAIACTERAGDLLTNFKLHANLGIDALAAGDIAAARAHLEVAAETAASIGVGTHPMSINRGWVQLAERNYDRAQSLFCEALRANRRAGDNLGMAYSLLALACLAGGQGSWQRAGTLHGAAQALLDRTGNPWESYEDGLREVSLRHAQAAIGREQFDRAFAAGQALSLEHAVGLALGRDPA
jgi:predicted ATPase/class 3 adenylate cyclase